VLVTVGNRHNGREHYIRSYKHTNPELNKSSKITVDQVVQASTATPKQKLQFEDEKKDYITDGSEHGLNTTFEFYNELLTYENREPKASDLVLSLGVDESSLSMRVGSIASLARTFTNGFRGTVNKDSLMFRPMDPMKDLSRMCGVQYYRFLVRKGPEIKLSTPNSFTTKDLDRIRLASQTYIESPHEYHQLELCANALVEARKYRLQKKQKISFNLELGTMKSADSTDVKLGLKSRYRCPMPDECDMKSRIFVGYDDLMAHLILKHNQPLPDSAHEKEMNALIERGRIEA
jgi:hypothetical protein